MEQFEGDRAVMLGDAAHHLGRVLRAQAGQVYELSDGTRVRLARIEKAARDRIEFSLGESLAAAAPPLETTLLLSIVKFDSFEWALQKATELGAARIVPLASERSEKALIAAAAKRAERWRRVLVEASEQSRRVRVPVLESAEKPEKAFARADAGVKIMLSERQTALSLRGRLKGKRAQSVALAIGPEGGWTDKEFGTAAEAGFCEASMGRLILRTETAVIAALASVNYGLGREELGEMSGGE